MNRRYVVPVAFLSLLLFGVYRHVEASWSTWFPVLMQAVPPQSGTFPDRWINGMNCGTEPEFQAHAYNDDLYIIRQSKCETFEAPFLYLIFGDNRALLLDTGANSSSPVHETVMRTISEWLKKKGKSSIPLTVAHTHSHGDHIAGDNQFKAKPGVSTVVGTGQKQVEDFWGFKNFPNDVVTIDLGNRVLDVLGTPGHQAQSVTLYDRKTQLLLSGDIVYPGHLFVFSANDWQVFVDSIERMVDWAAKHPVTWVVGCHIEFSDQPFRSFAWGTKAHPTEHRLQLEPSVLLDVLKAARGMDGNPQCEVFENFVIHPVYKCGITWNP